MSLDMNATGGSERDPVRRVVLSAEEKSLLSTGLQDNNTFGHFNGENQLYLEQGWNHDAQIDIFSGKKQTTRQNSWRGSFVLIE